MLDDEAVVECRVERPSTAEDVEEEAEPLAKEEQIIIDIKNLEFLNSAGIKCLLDFLKAKPPNSKVLIKTDMKKTWQRKSMVVIQSIDEDNISLE